VFVSSLHQPREVRDLRLGAATRGDAAGPRPLHRAKRTRFERVGLHAVDPRVAHLVRQHGQGACINRRLCFLVGVRFLWLSRACLGKMMASSV
jgi:hypothetical protein